MKLYLLLLVVFLSGCATAGPTSSVANKEYSCSCGPSAAVLIKR